MTSTNKLDIEKYVMEVPPKLASPTLHKNSFIVDVILRLLLFASTLTAIAFLVTSNQTVRGPFPVVVVAKFNNSRAFSYLLAALSVAGLYWAITILASISVILKPQRSAKLLLNFALWDVVILRVVATATIIACGDAYIGLKSNEKLFCYVFDKFCRHIGGSLAVSLFVSVLLGFLVWHNENALRKRITE